MINWSFDYVIPSLLILIIIMGYYFSLPRLPVRLNKVFLAIMVNEGFVIISDIIASWACNEYKTLPTWIVVLLNTLYFAAFFSGCFLFFEMCVTLLRIAPSRKNVRKWLIRIPFILSEILTVSSAFFGFIFYIDETGYHRGPLHFMVYVTLYFYIFMNYFTLFTHWNRLRRRHERNGIIGYTTMLLIGAALRYCLPLYLIFDTFCLMAVLIIYLSYGNPEFFLETRNMAFNSKALRIFIEENEDRGRYKILSFIIRDYHDLRDIYGTIQMNQGIALISEFLKKNYPEVIQFYYQNGRFVLLGNRGMDWEEIHEEIRHRFLLPWKSDDAELYLEVGFALVDLSKGYGSADEVLNSIGLLLERADRLGDDYNVLTDDNALQDYADRIYLKKTMENAIDHKAVEIYLQPLIDANKRTLVGAEALARIRDEKGHIVPPGAFIPIAEQNGRINELGEQVFEKVCQFIADSDVDSFGLQFINVNLSPIQFMRTDLGERFLKVVDRYGVDPSRIHLEITEEAMIDDQQMEKQIQAMQRDGFRFVLDDYGKGYSNLTRLKKSPFINVKLDMEIVWDYCNAPDHILPMMVGAFKKMHFGITAEGIETEEMAKKMTNIGCDYLQGMLFSAPLPPEEFLEQYRGY
ncbi:EAL domain-containing protein [Butyrivibrio sp. FC2001]|uniref:EAL domain-containing protein n=1 Tax=Butyrivibrio sp. FC2001 TaxID=1280671 RepID=UPI00047E9329|nr:EAL domain-containing protein [Butyrivibrio sp. FC2001]